MSQDKLEHLRALVIEDNSAARSSLEVLLKTNGIKCDVAQIGQEGLEIAKLRDYDIIILELLLPDIDGYEILLKLRAAKIFTPVLILSGLSQSSNQIKGFKLGADDYLTKPQFNKEEVISRILSVIKKSRKAAYESEIKIGQIKIDLEAKTVEVNKKKIELTKSEYSIIKMLAKNKNLVVSKEMILSQLYGNKEGDEPNVKVVDVFVCNLRKKISKVSQGKKYITTLWGRGYTLKEPK